jgi:molybdopterin synthase sulfur carrier subunit
MPVTFLIPMSLRPFANGKSHILVEEAPIILADALEALWKQCPGMRHRVVTEQAQIREHINVFVGKEDVRHTGGLQTPVPDNVEISIIPAISGGCPAWFRVRFGASHWMALVMLSLGTVIGCDVNTALDRLSQARHLSADLLVQFTKAADAANRAVMADTDEASVAFAREAEQAKEKVQADIDALRPLLADLYYSDEGRFLQEFVNRFTEYRELDRRVLDLAVENTNLKAQRLSFGPAQEAADSFRDSLRAVAPLVLADKWRVEALVATAIATVREIQVLQAPHIADADETVMTRMEKSMATSEAAARNALNTLSSLVEPKSQARIAAARGALDRFMAVNQQIISLSRRNTNVRSLALSLNQKRTVIAECENSLHSLRDALSKRGFIGTR